MRIKYLNYFFLLVLLITLACHSSPKLYSPGWSNLTLTAEGEGASDDDAENDAQARLLACRAAKMDAYRKLAEKIYGVQVRGSTRVVDFIAHDDRIKSSISGFIKKARVVEEITKPDGTCQVKIELFLGKDFEKIINAKKGD